MKKKANGCVHTAKNQLEFFNKRYQQARFTFKGLSIFPILAPISVKGIIEKLCPTYSIITFNQVLFRGFLLFVSVIFTEHSRFLVPISAKSTKAILFSCKAG